MPAPALRVVIPAYNQAATLRRTREALEQQPLDPHLYEVIVVDDGSTDETAALVRGRSADDPRVHLLQHGTNRGRSAARNSGIRTARGEIVVLIDSDILVRPDFLAHHLDAHRRSLHPVLCRGPVVDLPDGRLPEKPPALATSPAYLTTANASLPRQELLTAGLFDENFPAYGWEDFDMGFRLQRRGVPPVSGPASRLAHPPADPVHPPPPHPLLRAGGRGLPEARDGAASRRAAAPPGP